MTIRWDVRMWRNFLLVRVEASQVFWMHLKTAYKKKEISFIISISLLVLNIFFSDLMTDAKPYNNLSIPWSTELSELFSWNRLRTCTRMYLYHKMLSTIRYKTDGHHNQESNENNGALSENIQRLFCSRIHFLKKAQMTRS